MVPGIRRRVFDRGERQTRVGSPYKGLPEPVRGRVNDLAESLLLKRPRAEERPLAHLLDGNRTPGLFKFPRPRGDEVENRFAFEIEEDLAARGAPEVLLLEDRNFRLDDRFVLAKKPAA